MEDLPTEAALLLSAIRSRRSTKPKALKPDAVPERLLHAILEAARWAPCHGKTEPWRYVVYTGESRRALGEAFAAGYREAAEPQGKFTQEAFDAALNRVWDAPVWIALVVQPALRPDGSTVMPEHEEMLAVACSVQNLHLMACALGLAGMWSTGSVLMHRRVQAFVDVPQPSRLMGFFMLGWPIGDAAPASRRAVADFTRWHR